MWISQFQHYLKMCKNKTSFKKNTLLTTYSSCFCIILHKATFFRIIAIIACACRPIKNIDVDKIINYFKKCVLYRKYIKGVNPQSQMECIELFNSYWVFFISCRRLQ